MGKFFIRAEHLDEQGMNVDNDHETLFGQTPVEHDERDKAVANCLELRTTGDWPETRPNYWVEDEHGEVLDVDWADLEETLALAKDFLGMR